VRWAAVAALVVVAACSGGDDDGASEVTTTSTTEERPSSTTAPSTTTTTCAPPDGDVVATVDLDGDGVDERWVPAGRGASVDIVRLEQLDGCTPVPVTVEGSPAEFAVGGTVLLLQGIRCEDGLVVHLGATSDDGVTYAALDLLYELRNGELVRVDDRTATIAADDPVLRDYSSFTCEEGA
jgi:hypothetical protein